MSAKFKTLTEFLKRAMQKGHRIKNPHMGWSNLKEAYPELAEQFRKESMKGNYVPPKTDHALHRKNLKKMSKVLKKEDGKEVPAIFRKSFKRMKTNPAGLKKFIKAGEKSEKKRKK